MKQTDLKTCWNMREVHVTCGHLPLPAVACREVYALCTMGKGCKCLVSLGLRKMEGRLFSFGSARGWCPAREKGVVHALGTFPALSPACPSTQGIDGVLTRGVTDRDGSGFPSCKGNLASRQNSSGLDTVSRDETLYRQGVATASGSLVGMAAS